MPQSKIPTRAQTQDPPMSNNDDFLPADPPKQSMAVGSAAASLKAIETLAERIPVETVVERINSLINATRTTRSGVVEPDVRAVEAGVKLYFAYVVGMPVQRQHIIEERRGETEADFFERVRNSPAMAAAVIKFAKELEAKHPDAA